MSAVLQMLLGGVADTLPGLKPPIDLDGLAGFSVDQSGSISFVPRTIVIGAPGYQGGAVFIYRYNGLGWSFLQTIPNTGLNTAFGQVVAIDDDGLKILIGAPLEALQGRVHAYIWDGGTERYVADGVIDPNAGTSPGTSADFGASIVINKQGTACVIGAPEGISSDAGVAYAFQYTAGWVPVIGQILPTAPDPNSNFGTNLAMTPDGLQLFVTRPNATPTPDFWWYIRASVLVPFGPPSDTASFNGASVRDVAFNPNGTLSFVVNSNGVIFSYADTSPGVWVQADTELPAAGADQLTFGLRIAANDQDLLVGASGDSGGLGGAIALYTFDASGILTFVRVEHAPTDGEQLGAGFGYDVSIIDTAPEMTVGQPFLDRADIADAGNVYSLPI